MRYQLSPVCSGASLSSHGRNAVGKDAGRDGKACKTGLLALVVDQIGCSVLGANPVPGT